MSSFLNGVRYYPNGNTFKWKIDAIKRKEVTVDELKLLQYASLFNIVMFDHDTMKESELDTLKTELDQIESELGIQYTDGRELVYDDKARRYNMTEGQKVTREQFVKNRIESYKDKNPNENEKDSKIFNMCCSIYQRDNLEINYYGSSFTPFIAEYFGITHNNGNIDLSSGTDKELSNSLFLFQVMSGKNFKTYDDYTFKSTEFNSMDLYKIAKTEEIKLENDGKSPKEKQQISRDALRTIASRQRKDKINETFNRFKSKLKEMLNPSKERNVENEKDI